MWPVIDRAISFVLRLQQPGGEVLWSLEPDGTPGRFALLTSSSSIHHSLRCAVAVAERWATSGRSGSWPPAGWPTPSAAARKRSRPKTAGPWTGTTRSCAGRCQARPAGSVSSRVGTPSSWTASGCAASPSNPWVTAAETAECAMALDAVGLVDEAVPLLDWTRHLRADDGAYWTGCVHPECVRFPGGERSTYTAAAVLLADHALYGMQPPPVCFGGKRCPR